MSTNDNEISGVIIHKETVVITETGMKVIYEEDFPREDSSSDVPKPRDH